MNYIPYSVSFQDEKFEFSVLVLTGDSKYYLGKEKESVHLLNAIIANNLSTMLLSKSPPSYIITAETPFAVMSTQ